MVVAGQRQSGAVPVLGVTGQSDPVIGGFALLGEDRHPPEVIAVTRAQRLDEPAPHHGVPDDHDTTVRLHGATLGNRDCQHVASGEPPVTVCSPVPDPDRENSDVTGIRRCRGAVRIVDGRRRRGRGVIGGRIVGGPPVARCWRAAVLTGLHAWHGVARRRRRGRVDRRGVGVHCRGRRNEGRCVRRVRRSDHRKHQQGDQRGSGRSRRPHQAQLIVPIPPFVVVVHGGDGRATTRTDGELATASAPSLLTSASAPAASPRDQTAPAGRTGRS